MKLTSWSIGGRGGDGDSGRRRRSKQACSALTLSDRFRFPPPLLRLPTAGFLICFGCGEHGGGLVGWSLAALRLRSCLPLFRACASSDGDSAGLELEGRESEGQRNGGFHVWDPLFFHFDGFLPLTTPTAAFHFLIKKSVTRVGCGFLVHFAKISCYVKFRNLRPAVAIKRLCKNLPTL